MLTSVHKACLIQQLASLMGVWLTMVTIRGTMAKGHAGDIQVMSAGTRLVPSGWSLGLSLLWRNTKRATAASLPEKLLGRLSFDSSSPRIGRSRSAGAAKRKNRASWLRNNRVDLRLQASTSCEVDKFSKSLRYVRITIGVYSIAGRSSCRLQSGRARPGRLPGRR